MNSINTLIVISLAIVCEGNLGGLLSRLSAGNNRGPYNNWEVTNFQTYNSYQNSPALNPGNIIITEVETGPNYQNVQNQRYPVVGNQYYQGYPNGGQPWNSGATNKKPQEETVVVVVYDNQPSKNQQQTPNVPVYVNQGNYPPNNNNANDMVLNQIANILNQQQNGGRRPVQNYPQQNNGQQSPPRQQDFINDQPQGTNASNENELCSNEDNYNRRRCKPKGNRGPNYPDNNGNRFVGTTSERTPKTTTETNDDEEFNIDVRASFDKEKPKN